MTKSSLLQITLLSACSIMGVAIVGCGGGDDQQEAVDVVLPDAAAVANNGPIKIDFGAGTKPILLSPQELQERLKKSRSNRVLNEIITVVDVRPRAEYEKGHVPKSTHVDVEEWRKQALAPNGLQDTAAWSDLLGKLGVNRLSYVIVYADKPLDAARVWWTLKYLGIANAAILDGGWKNWVDARGEITAEVPEIPQFKAPIDLHPERLSQLADLKTAHTSEDVKVVDARSQDEYGKGRIPGAVRIEWNELLTADGRFKPVAELKTIFRERGIDDSKTAVTYCESGGRASLDAFALELAGHPKVQNYYCSWQEWSKDNAAPQEK